MAARERRTHREPHDPHTMAYIDVVRGRAVQVRGMRCEDMTTTALLATVGELDRQVEKLQDRLRDYSYDGTEKAEA